MENRKVALLSSPYPSILQRCFFAILRRVKGNNHLLNLPRIRIQKLHKIITVISIVLLRVAGDAVSENSNQNLNVEFSPKLVQEAESGDAKAEFQLGICYLLGKGVAQNDGEAIKWLTKAADKEHVKALHVLGGMYLTGASKNENKAFAYLKKAAELNDLASMPLVADCLFDGRGTIKNQNEAFNWYLKAAEKGDVNSQRMVGLIYKYNFDKEYTMNGHNIEINALEKSIEKSEYWLNQAAQKDDEVSIDELVSERLKQGREIDAFKILWAKLKEKKPISFRIFGRINSTGRYLPKNVEVARTWYYQGVQLGDDICLLKLAQSFAEDEPKNLGAAIRYLEKAKEEKKISLRDQSLLENLKKNYTNSEVASIIRIRPDVPAIQDTVVFTKAEANDGFALYLIGSCYAKGEGIRKNLEEAIKYFAKSAEASSPEGLYQMGLEYQSGRILKQDKEIAFENFLKAAEMGSPLAANVVGRIYSNQPFTLIFDGETLVKMADDPNKKNLGKAIYWLTRASEDKGTSEVALDPLINALLENGQGEDALKKIPKAKYWEKNYFGKYLLGKMYYEGKAGDKNIEEGKKLLLESSQLGYGPATEFCKVNGISKATNP